MDLEELRRIAAREEMSLNFISKDEMISKALSKLQGFDDIVLKGGTAINRSYLKNKRFSEDMDFDLITSKNAKDALARTDVIVKNLDGFNVARPRIMKNIIRYDLFYTNTLDHKDKIRLEFKAIKKALNYSKKIVNFGFVPYESSLLNVYDMTDLIAHKIECILNRTEGKDMFDLNYLIEMPHKHVKLTNKPELIKRLSMDEKQIRLLANAANHYIPRGQRPSWPLFLEELKEKIRAY